MKAYPDRRYRAAVVAIARAAFAGDEERLGAAVAEAIAVVPIRECDGCGTPYLQADGRQRRFCSARCCYRITKREGRRRARLATSPSEAAV